jgi:hypothetical protein
MAKLNDLISKMSALTADLREAMQDELDPKTFELRLHLADELLDANEEFLNVWELKQDYEDKHTEYPESREHTATTTHTVEVTTTVPGDEGIDTEYLVDVLMWGVDQHNALVEAQSMSSADLPIQIVSMSASMNPENEGNAS